MKILCLFVIFLWLIRYSDEASCYTLCGSGSDCHFCTAGDCSGLSSCTSSCMQCQRSMYCDGTNDLPVNCGPDYYQDQLGACSSSACTPCPFSRLTFSRTHAANYETGCYCPPGYHGGSTGTCSQCSAGTFKITISNDILDCEGCPVGKYSNAGSTSVSQCYCDKGYETVACTPCEQGWFKDTYYSGSCEQCDVTLTTEFTGTKSDTLCVCAPGRKYSGSWCVECGVGYWNSEYSRSTTCTACDSSKEITVGTFSTAETDCQCKEGWYRTVPLEVCQECPRGTYKDEVDDSVYTSCTSCTLGRYTEFLGSTQSSDCVCVPGKKWTGGWCVDCGTNYYKPGYNLDIICSMCDTTKETTVGVNSEAQTDCQCKPGWYRTIPLETCIKCPKGTWKSEVDDTMTACHNCVDGKTTEFDNSMADTDCKCAPGYKISADVCVPCGIGWFSNSYNLNTFCSQCDPSRETTNTTTATNQVQCECKKGWVRDTPLQPCSQCPQNSYKDAVNDALYTSCTSCGSNYVTASAGSASIDDCTCGDSNYDSGSACTPCLNGWWKSGYGDICTQCLDGKTTENTGASDISSCVCAPGKKWFGGSCTECGSNYWKSGYNLDVLCTQCDITKETTIGTTSSSIFDCFCKDGWYRTIPGAICEQCLQGFWKSTIGYLKNCTACLDGKTTSGIGSTGEASCVCEPGKKWFGGSCTECGSNYWKSGYNLDVVCTQCDITKETTAGTQSTSQTDCECKEGWYRSVSLGVCQECPKGTYKSVVDDSTYTTCTSCLNGKTTENTTSTSSDDCKCGPGKKWSGSSCVECETGYWKSDYSLSTTCNACDAVLETTTGVNSVAQTDCQCVEGYVRSAPLATCTACPLDTYKDVVNDATYTTCISCSSNYVTESSGSSSISDCTCQPGYSDNSESCEQCAKGYYKPGYGRSCLSCGDHYTTEEEGSVSNSSCICKKGYKKRGEECVSATDGGIIIWGMGMMELILFGVGALVSLLLLCLCCTTILCCVCKRFKKKMKYYKKYDKDIEFINLEKEGKFSLEKFESSKKFFTIDQKNVVLIRVLGSGGFAEVFEVDWNGQRVAMKLFQVKHFTKDDEYEDFNKELKILSSISHPNILQFFGATIKPPRVGIIVELCLKGDLESYYADVTISKSFSTCLKILYGISLGMEYLHNREIIHRDLKAKNVLLTDNLSPKICDFGLSRVVAESSNMTRNVGTRNYMAPELVKGGKYTVAVDVFSYSILMWELLHESFNPYPSEPSNVRNIEFCVASSEDFRPKVAEKFENDEYKFFVKLMKNAWKADPEERPSFSDIKNVLAVKINA